MPPPNATRNWSPTKKQLPIRKCIQDIIELFNGNDTVTSGQIAEVTGDYQGSDAMTRCRSWGLEFAHAGFVQGSAQIKTYRLANWRTLETIYLNPPKYSHKSIDK